MSIDARTEVDGPAAAVAKTAGNLLEVDNLRVWFETPRGLVRAVDGVDLTLRRQETLGIVGESGSGKSVLSRAIMKILAPNARVLPGSHIRLNDVDLASVSPKQNRHLWGVDLAMVFQDPMTSLTRCSRWASS
ncbi:hypothetical protein Psuf_001770 [Phytohabitans suffuscus]|uniref:ABC transporter domain-containing protein n=1 Tax=Phytohabitans suffuscus TaxID=624315 RepID=A0A6F8Y9Q7_9ACTN|nr:ATP-binding cassette domain-containing protein [Phytohabitans suffuscus]BCB82864.1 hypothetical protein Psuf_001770 [Phytohabitans suffuscus]